MIGVEVIGCGAEVGIWEVDRRWLVAGRRKKDPFASLVDRARWDVERLTSLLGISVSCRRGLATWRSVPSFSTDEAGLLVWEDGMVEMRLSHEDRGRESSRSAEPSLPSMPDNCLPCLLCELPRDWVKLLSLVDICSASRRVFRRNNEVDRRGRTLKSEDGVTVAGCETVRRAGKEVVGGLE